MFNEVQSETFDEREKRILQFWNQNRIFERSVEEKAHLPLFTFYDGPPFATGLPHYGHILAGTIKDVILRFKTMEGFYVPRRFGWDCHGLPIENEIEKTFNLSGAPSIEAFGIANFNEECRKIVLRYTEEWKSIVQRSGRWVDFVQTYRTMDKPFMESVWWVFQQLYSKGLVYEGFKVMPFSAKLGTPLSNFEAGENYKEVDDPALTVSFKLVDEDDTYLLAWTTTPWTLISNLAVMAGPEIDYVKLQDHTTGKKYILAAKLVPSNFKNQDSYTILSSFQGFQLAGKRYHPLFPYFAEEAKKGAFRVIMESNVSTDDGTGLVHCAPAFGELDFYACQRENIELVCPVNNNGLFTDEIPEYAGLFVKDADKAIIKKLKEDGVIYHHGTCHHRYPFCWRSDTPLIYKAVSTWFVSVERIKQTLLDVNQQIHWTPSHIKNGRFGKWLEGARDWAISRNRYWGTPIPIWRSEKGDILVIGSIAELEKLTGASIEDLHRHYIDHLTIEKDGVVYKRVSEVFDCWFESGSMPYAQNHYPFENRELFEKNFPADFIAEGLDQTRGWFYTLTILAGALFGKPPFKNVVVNGIVLASDGSKMSKRLKNYPDPVLVMEKYGADAVRLYMMHSPAVKADDLCFTEAGVEVVLRQVLIPFWNAFSFFNTYAHIYKWNPTSLKYNELENVMDRWIISMLNKLIDSVKTGMDQYDLNLAVEPFVAFIDQLTNWYIRRSRRRFWNNEASPDREQAFMTLYHVLVELSKIAAPFIPFLSEAIYRNLRSPDMPESVHLCAFPAYHAESRDVHLELAMEAAQKTVSLGHSLRKENKLKVRQPLSAAYVASPSLQTIEFLQEQQHLIADELNVKQVLFSNDETQFVSLKAKPNFRVLGKKVGKLMKQAQTVIDGFDQHQLAALLNGGNVTIQLDDTTIILDPEDVQVERSVREGIVAANAGEITIALDTQLSEDLQLEGLAREIVNKVNTMRREAELAVTDRIHVKMETTQRVQQSFANHTSYIQNEILALSVKFEKCEGTEWDLNGENAKIAIVKD